MRDVVPAWKRPSRRGSAHAGDRDPVGVRLGLPRAAGRIAERDRAGRAAGGAAARSSSCCWSSARWSRRRSRSLFGALTVFAGRGVLALLAGAMTIDALSLVVCTMMGLALGVDYSLLIVSRFREELGRDADPWRRGRGDPLQRRAHHALRRR